jgi:two-component system nitrate/nitrite response regulator NarL
VPRAPELTSVAVVEDHVLFAEALDVTLTLEGYEVTRLPVGDQIGPSQLLAALLRLRPDIAMLDLDLGAGGDGARLVRPLTQAGIAATVVTGSLDGARWGECLSEGARAVLSKSAPLDQILAAISRVAEGRPVHSVEERQRLVNQFRMEGETAKSLRRKLDLLTSRESEVLAHLMRGRPVRDIAQASFVSEATVRTQVKSILAKLEVTSQLAAVGAAHQVGWQPTTLRRHR